LQRLNNVGWQEDERGCYVSSYMKQIATVWDDEVMGWSYLVNGQSALCADTKVQAMRGCAEMIARLGA
jgi:hypothetical protein